METTVVELTTARAEERWQEQQRGRMLATLSAHLSAATARLLELVWKLHEKGDSDDLPRFLAYRCGITGREAREHVRVAEVLQELPAIRAAFSRGELILTRLRPEVRSTMTCSTRGSTTRRSTQAGCNRAVTRQVSD